MTKQDTMDQKKSFEETSPYDDFREARPEHLRAPDGLSQSVHDINLSLTALLLEAQAGYRWLNRPLPDADAAKTSFSKMLAHAKHVDRLVRDLTRTHEDLSEPFAK